MRDARQALTVSRRRAWRLYADARRLPRAGRAVPQDLRRRRGVSDEQWLAVTSERHRDYRARHRPAAGGVAIVCVSRRPQLLGSVVDGVRRQRDVEPEFVLVPNGPGWDRQLVDDALDDLPNARSIWEATSDTLGHGLNAGLASTEARFVAKFDDDDHYGAAYLADALRAHGFAGAGIVGKHSYYARVAGVDDLVLRFPGRDFGYSSTLAGGTLVIDRERTGDLEFRDLSLGEDRAFIADCHRRGVSTYAADRFNFVQFRGDDNTWHTDLDHFMVGSVRVDERAPEHVVDR